MKNLESFLQKQGHTPQSIRTYLYHIRVFLADNPHADTYVYQDILNYFQHYKPFSKSSRNVPLVAIKRYYDFLINAQIRNDHPCRRLYFRNNRRKKQILHTDLFTSTELELLLCRKERYPQLTFRNQIIISLLIFQALTPGEISNLKLNHLDLDTGTIYIPPSRKTASRKLEILPRQYKLFDKYLTSERELLLKASRKDNTLILNKLGTSIKVDDINYLVESSKTLFPDRNLNARTIRQSVISNWLNEKKIPLEQAQLLAGHKWISSTLIYRQNSLEEQRKLINLWFPLS